MEIPPTLTQGYRMLRKRGKKPGTHGLNYTRLSQTIADLWDVPNPDRTSLPFKTAKAVAKAITNLALTGEDIKIEGFGIFRWVDRPPMKRNTTYFYNPEEPVHIVKEIPAKRYLAFYPSRVLYRMINDENRQPTRT